MFKSLSPTLLGISGQPSELIELALSHGFRSLEIDVLDFAEQARTRGIAHARRLIDSAKLQVGAFELPIKWQAEEEVFADGLREVDSWAVSAAEAGFRRAVTSVEPANDERPFHQNFELCRQRLGKLAAALDKHAIRLGVSFSASADLRRDRAFEFIHQLDTLLLLIGGVGAGNIGVALDLWDLHVSGGTIDDLRKLGADRLVAVRISDAPADVAPADCTPAERLLPGDGGAIDASAVLATLAEIAYDGAVTPLADREQFRNLRREAIVKRTGESLDRVWKGAGLSPAGKLLASARR